MKLKKKSERFSNVCNMARCDAGCDLVGYAAGVAFSAAEGEVTLCSEHAARRDREREAEKATQVKDTPAADPQQALQTTLQAEAAEAKDVLVMVKGFTIAGQPDVDFANECLTEVKGKLRWLKDKREEATKPMNAALKTIRGWFKPAEEFYEECEGLWKLKIRDGLTALDAAQQRALAAASQAHQAGDLRLVTEAMAVASQATVEAPANISVIERWGYKIIDEMLLPREYLMPDAQKIAGVVRAMGASTRIPGVEVFRDDIVQQRRA